jgi:hypothetical protein
MVPVVRFTTQEVLDPLFPSRFWEKVCRALNIP